jgi:hypothetical protein
MSVQVYEGDGVDWRAMPKRNPTVRCEVILNLGMEGLHKRLASRETLQWFADVEVCSLDSSGAWKKGVLPMTIDRMFGLEGDLLLGFFSRWTELLRGLEDGSGAAASIYSAGFMKVKPLDEYAQDYKFHWVRPMKANVLVMAPGMHSLSVGFGFAHGSLM